MFIVSKYVIELCNSYLKCRFNVLLQQFHRSLEAALSSLREMELWMEFTAYLGFHLTFRNSGEIYLFFMPGQFI